MSHKHEALSLDSTALVTSNTSRGRDGIKRRLDPTGDGNIESGVRKKKRGGREKEFFFFLNSVFAFHFVFNGWPQSMI